MPEWLTDAASPEASLSSTVLLIRLVVSLGYGIVVAGLYRLSHGRHKPDAGVLAATLVLLAVLIAMITLVIGNSVARAFGLVGALSIVRFRTVVDDTRDTAFVIFAVIVGMASGAGQFLVPAVGVPVVGVASVVLSLWGASSLAVPPLDGVLSVRFALGRSPEELLKPLFDRHLNRFHLVSTGTARQGAALDLTYNVRLKSEPSLSQLVTELNQIEGILGVELKRA